MELRWTLAERLAASRRRANGVPGMKCPNCQLDNDRVIDTRTGEYRARVKG